MKRYASTLVLLALALGLGAYVALVERKKPSTSSLKEREKRIVRDLDRAAIKTIRLERGAETVVLRKDNDAWRIEKPVEFPANSGAVESLISAVEFLDLQRRIDDAKPAQYGLDKPRARIEIEGGTAVRLRVGGDDATGRSVYLGAEGSGPVWVVERNFFEALSKPVAELRDRRAVFFDRAKLKTLTLARGGVRTTLERNGEAWHVVSEGRVLASADRVAAILAKLDDMKATRIVSEGLAELGKYGLDPAARSVELDASGVESLLLGNTCGETSGEIYAARKGKASAILCVKEEDAEALFPHPETLRETRLVGLEADDVRRIVIEAAGKKLALERKGEMWSVTEPAAEPADEEVVRKWIADLSAFRATQSAALDAPRQGLSKPARVVIEGDGRTLSLAFGKVEGGTLWVRRDEEPAVMKVHAEVAGSLSATPLAFRKRRLLDFSRYDLKRLVARAGDVEEDAQKLETGGWRLDKPSKLPGDESVIDDVAGALAELRAEKFIPAEAAQGLGKAARVMVATVEPPAGLDGHGQGHEEDDNDDEEEDDGGARPKGKQVITLHIGAALPDQTCHGRLESKGPAFVLAEKTCKSLRSPLVSRKLFDLEESKIVSFSLRRGAEEVVLEKRGPDWHRAGGARIDPARIEDLLGLIRNARAADVRGYGAGAVFAARLSLIVRTDGKPDQKLEIGPGLEARLSGRDATYLVDTGFVESLERLTF